MQRWRRVVGPAAVVLAIAVGGAGGYFAGWRNPQINVVEGSVERHAMEPGAVT